MKGKRKFLAPVMVFCFSLVVLSGWLILNPISVFAASCTAQCPGRASVTCGGNGASVCTAIDGQGCTSNLGGAQAKTCSGGVGEEDLLD